MYRLKERRIAAGLSQVQLAEAADVPVRLIRYYEAEAASAHRDINNASALQVWKLSQALGCEVIDILEPEKPEE